MTKKGKSAKKGGLDNERNDTELQVKAAHSSEEVQSSANDRSSSLESHLEDDDSAAAATPKILMVVVVLLVLLCLLGTTVVVESSINLNAARVIRTEADQVADTVRLGSEVLEELRSSLLVTARPVLANIENVESAVAASRAAWDHLKSPMAELQDSWSALELRRDDIKSTTQSTITVSEVFSLFEPLMESIVKSTIEASSSSMFTPNRQRVSAGLSCVLTELLPHIDSFVIASWSHVPPGMADSNLRHILHGSKSIHFSVCAQRYIPAAILGALHPDTIAHLTLPVGIAAFNTSSAGLDGLSAEWVIHAYDRRLDAVREIMDVTADQINDAAAASLTNAVSGTILPLVLAVLLMISCIVTLVVCLKLSKPLLKETAKLASDRAYSTLDDRPKSMRRYVEIVQSVTLRASDDSLNGEIIGAGNLRDILTFVEKLRPYVMQTSLGELESIPLTGSQATTKQVKSGNRTAVSEFQALQEIQMRELRTEVGLQTVLGTVMAVQLSPLCGAAGVSLQGTEATISLSTNTNHRALFGADAPADLNRWVQDSIKKIVRLINGCGGVVHSFNGDTLIALWNVCGAAEGAHNASIDCALKIHQSWVGGPFGKTLGGMNDQHTGDQVRSEGKNLSTVERPNIGIAQSLLVAGNIDTMSIRNQLIVVGPAMMRAGMAVRACAPLGANIVVDSVIADVYSTLTGSLLDHCVREGVSIQTGLNEVDEELFFVVHRHRYRADRLNTWRGVFKEIQKLTSNNRGLDAPGTKKPQSQLSATHDVKQVISMIKQFRTGATVIEARTGGGNNVIGIGNSLNREGGTERSGASGGASTAELNFLAHDTVINYWLRRLELELKEAGGGM